jgi:type IV pilus assembly protein PilB
MTVQFNEDSQNKKLGDLQAHEEEELAKILAEKYGLGYLDLSTIPVNIDALRVINEEGARAADMAVFNVFNKRADIAIISPNNIITKERIEDIKKAGYEPNIFMVSHASLKKVWERYKDLSYSLETKGGTLDISNEEISKVISNITGVPDIKTQIEIILSEKKSYRISKVLEIMIGGAIALNASDIHIEPEENDVRLRYRLNGILTETLRFDRATFMLLLSRIKLISNLKLNLDGAQDGRFSIKISSGDVEIRTSLLPGAYSESVVLRILNPETAQVNLEGHGIHPRLLAIFESQIKKPNGMILVTGPTGSGKTTTLYAFLKKIYSPEVKIITIENPIEYHLAGVVQTQTDPEKDYSFASGLRSALRQDPDVIMVGEIRDSETAEVAVNAALTGHLVLSTLHTNNAAGAFPRLIDLGVNPKVLTSALSISIAQRLVRVLCPDCKKEMTPSESDQKTITTILDSIADKSYLEGIQIAVIWEAKGCQKCNASGYVGRIGIYEAILPTKEVEETVLQNPSEREVEKAAEGQHILTMKQDGLIKVLTGVTSLSELSRVIDLAQEA